MIVSFEEYENKKKEVNEYKSRILKLVNKFILSNEEFLKNHKLSISGNGRIYSSSVDFYIDSQRSGNFVVKYYNTLNGMGTDEVYFSHKEYLELIDFLKYEDSANKYNL